MKFQWKKTACWIPAVCIMLMIFGFSAMNANESDAMSTPLAQWLAESWKQISKREVSTDSWPFQMCVLIVRKSAHMTEYALLGAAGYFGFQKTTSLKGYKIPLAALVMSVAYAVADEVHQLFVPGRSGKIMDVGIDSMGAFIGIMVYMLVYWLAHRVKANISNTK